MQLKLKANHSSCNCKIITLKNAHENSTALTITFILVNECTTQNLT